MSKRLSVYLMALPETPELAEAAVEGGADLLELGFPLLRPAGGRAGDPARGRAGAPARHAHSAVLECLAEARERVGPTCR